MEWMLMPLKRYAEFTGRSRRTEFWMFALLNIIVSVILAVLVLVVGGGASLGGMDSDDPFAAYGALFGGVGLLFVVWGLAILIPSIAVAVRRLHDRDMSGWWYLGFIVASAIPFVGFIASIAFIVIMALPGTPGPNRFGADPKGGTDPTVFE